MDITPYVDSLRRDLLAAAEAGSPEVAAAAERLGFALEPATRLALMEALSQAAAEITSAMPAGGVDVRLDGRDLAFVVDAAPPAPPTPPAPPAPPAPGAAAEAEDDDTVARITLRLPESLKTKAEDAAAASGASLNTWLVQAVRAATRDGAVHVDIDLSSMPFFGSNDPTRRGSRRMTGWV